MSQGLPDHYFRPQPSGNSAEDHGTKDHGEAAPEADDQVESGPLDDSAVSGYEVNSRFYNLQVEETVDAMDNLSSNPLTDLRERDKFLLGSEGGNEDGGQQRPRPGLSLPLDVASGPQQAGSIIFSPGGNEGYLFTDATPEDEIKPAITEASSAARPAAQATSTPREIHDEIFIERGERPTTVGQSSEMPPPPASGGILKQGGSPRPAQQAIQGRMEDFRLSLERDSAARGVGAARSLRIPGLETLVRPGVGREEFLMDPDSYNLEDAVRSGDTEASGLGPGAAAATAAAASSASPRSTGYLTDRANSPSVASVTSMQSVSSQVSTTGRRYLEWDPGSDLGYLGVETQVSQVQAAQSLSTLEKLAIGNYSDYLREEPEGKSSQGRDSARGGGAPLSSRLPPPAAPDDEMREARLHKFADSLMQQRRRREVELARQQRRRSRSRESVRSEKRQQGTKAGPASSSASNESSPARAALLRKSTVVHMEGSSSSHGSPLRSCSLTDVSRLELLGPAGGRSSSRCSSDQHLATVAAAAALPAAILSGPSSSSSTTTVVPIRVESFEDDPDLADISTDPRSLPPHLQDLIINTGGGAVPPVVCGGGEATEGGGGGGALLAKDGLLMSQASLSSRQSGSKSFETVIMLEQQVSKAASVTRCSNSADEAADFVDTEDEVQHHLARRASNSTREDSGHGGGRRVINAWQEEVEQVVKEKRRKGRSEEEGENGSYQGSRRRAAANPQSSEQSSVPTTSEEEEPDNNGGGKLPLRLVTNKSRYQADTSTMESTQMVDRAKSFEYIPGESFPIQENSSSYEYLPGHLVVDQRPPTVLTKQKERRKDEEETSSVYSSLSHRGGRLRRDDDGAAGGAAAPQLSKEELQQLSEQLKEKSRELLAANLSQTKQFFRKLKKYIDYLSSPSVTVGDCRVKQELAERIMGLLATEESRLDSNLLESLSRAASSTLQATDLSKLDMTEPTTEGGARSTEPTTKLVETEPTVSAKTTQALDELDQSGRRSGPGATTDQSSGSLDSTKVSPVSLAKLANWREAKTRSEERYEAKRLGRKDEKRQQQQQQQARETEMVQAIVRRRVEHMKKLRRDIKRLERLDSLIVGVELGHKTSFNVSTTTTDNSAYTMLSNTSKSELVESSPEVFKQKEAPKGTRDPSVAGSAVPPSAEASRKQKKQRKEGHKDSTEVAAKRKPTKKAPIGSQSIQQQTPTGSGRSAQQTSELSRSSGTFVVDRQQGKRPAATQNFAQMFPTPAASDADVPVVKMPTGKAVQTVGSLSPDLTDASGKENVGSTASFKKAGYSSPRRAKSGSQPKPVPKRKPTAYYLPFDNACPVRIGRRVLREVNQAGQLDSAGRSIVSGYVASLDGSSLSGRSDRQANKTSEEPQQPPPSKLSLQEALCSKRPDFVHRSERRRERLAKAREVRVEGAEKREAWLQEVARQSPRSQKLARPDFEPVKVQRLFNPREMVRSTRTKYESLPEYVSKQYEQRRRGKYQTNRIMAGVYGRLLQNNVLRGKVSMTHHKMVV